MADHTDSRTMQKVLDLRNRAVSEKTPQIFDFHCSLSISGRTDAPEVRCGLTDRHTDKPNYSSARCACTPRVNYATHRWPLFRVSYMQAMQESRLGINMNVFIINFITLVYYALRYFNG